MKLPFRQSHSAMVVLQLVIDGHVHSLSRIGPHFISLESRANLEQGEGRIMMSVDGEASEWPVRLLHGCVPFDDLVEVQHVMSGLSCSSSAEADRL